MPDILQKQQGGLDHRSVRLTRSHVQLVRANHARRTSVQILADRKMSQIHKP